MKTYAQAPLLVLVTVNDNETQAVLDAFVGEKVVPMQLSRAGVTYNDLGIHGGHHIIHTHCEMGAGGIGASQQRTHEAINHWHPKAVIAVGIAFGLDETKQKIGDVLVATQIQDYELGRQNKNGTLTPRGDKTSCSDKLRNRFRQTDAAKQRGNKDWPTVRFGLMLCGQKLVDNYDYRESLKQLFTEAIGGEMEGVGVYCSATSAKTDWIVVKAICDWGFDKSAEQKNEWQKIASQNAARVLKAALDVGVLYDAIDSQHSGSSVTSPDSRRAVGVNVTAAVESPVGFEQWLKKIVRLNKIRDAEIGANGLVRVGNCTVLDAPLGVSGYCEMEFERLELGPTHEALRPADVPLWRTEREKLIQRKVAGTSMKVVRFVGEVSDDRHSRIAYGQVDFVDARAYFYLLETSAERRRYYREQALRVIGEGTNLPNILSTAIVLIVGSEAAPELVIAKRKTRTGGFDGQTWSVSIGEQFKPISNTVGVNPIIADASVTDSVLRGLREELLGHAFEVSPEKISIHALCMEDDLNNFMFSAIADLRPLSFDTLAKLWLDSEDRAEHEAIAVLPATSKALETYVNSSELPRDLWPAIQSSESVRYGPGLKAPDNEIVAWQRNSHVRIALAMWYLHDRHVTR